MVVIRRTERPEGILEAFDGLRERVYDLVSEGERLGELESLRFESDAGGSKSGGLNIGAGLKELF
jgi:hypothetical protein